MIIKQVRWAALALVIVGCYSAPTANQGSQPAATESTDVVKQQDLVGYSFFDGKLVIPPDAQGTAFSPYDAPVLSVTSSIGKYVDRGDQLVKLTIPGADAATNSAKAVVNSQEAELNAQQSENSGPVIEAKRALAEARAAEVAARNTVANGGEADIEGATQIRQSAEADLQKAQAELRAVVQPTKDAINRASASLDTAKADAAKGIVRAPLSGVITTFDAKPGMVATAKQALVTITNFEKVKVQGMVPAELKDLVTKGTRVIISMNGVNSDPIDGVVLDVSIAAPQEGQTSAGYVAVIELLKPRSIVQTSLSVRRIGVKAGTAKDVLVVPVGAVSTKDGKSVVSVKNGDAWTETPVTLGITDGALVEIKSGLNVGAVVRVLTSAEVK